MQESIISIAEFRLIPEYLEKISENSINITGGKLIMNKTKTKAPLKEEDIKNHQIAYLEGYLWDNENAKQAMKKMVGICKADRQKIAFTLSDLFCVDRHRNSFEQLIKNHVDILFSNEEEICSMTQSSSIEDGIAYAKSLNIISIITIIMRHQ